MWEHEVLMQRYKRVESERDSLYKKFHGAVFAVQQKSGFKNLLLEKKLSALESGLEKTEAQLNEVLAQAKLDSSVLGSVSSKLEDVIEAKNQTGNSSSLVTASIFSCNRFSSLLLSPLLFSYNRSSLLL